MCSLEAVCTLRLLKEDIGVIKRGSNFTHSELGGGALKARPDERS